MIQRCINLSPNEINSYLSVDQIEISLVRTKIFGRPLKSNDFFKIAPNDVSFLSEVKRISLVKVVFATFYIVLTSQTTSFDPK